MGQNGEFTFTFSQLSLWKNMSPILLEFSISQIKPEIRISKLNLHDSIRWLRIF